MRIIANDTDSMTIPTKAVECLTKMWLCSDGCGVLPLNIIFTHVINWSVSLDERDA